MSDRDLTRKDRLLYRAEVRARAAEQRIVRRARAWYRATLILNMAEREAAREKAMGRFILACGLDEEARNDLRNAKRRCRL